MSVKIPFTDIAVETRIEEAEEHEGWIEASVQGNKYVQFYSLHISHTD